MNYSVTNHNKLAIIGASGHAKVIADIAKSINAYDEIAFLADTIPKTDGLNYLGKCDLADKMTQDYDFIVAIGNQKYRKIFTEKISKMNGFIATLVHPNAVIGSCVTIKEGTVVMAGTVINAYSKVGKSCIVNTCSSIDHDCHVLDYVHISVGAHLCGTVFVGDNTWIGAGATLINNINVKSDCYIGAGATVVKDITKSGLYLGVPAKLYKTNF